MYEQSMSEKIYEQAKNYGIDQCVHHILTDEQRIGLRHLFSSKFFKNYVCTQDVQKIDMFKDVGIEFLEHKHVISRSFSFDQYMFDESSPSIWQDRERNKNFCSSSPADFKIHLYGHSFLIWSCSRWCPEGHDVIYKMLSYLPQDKDIAEIFLHNLLNLVTNINRRTKIINVYGGSNVQITTRSGWEDLVLDDHLIALTKRDIEGWIAAEARYKKLRVPYRRGYLFEGPPGNGKTATTRTIISTYDFSAFMFNFSNPKLTDSDLNEAFQHAADCAPSVFVLEDIDRIFQDNNRSLITLSGLFNALDGPATYNGVVVIATANHPEVLDPAIRLRPGRFDVPVKFDNPSPELRIKYLNHVLQRSESSSVTEKCILRIVERTGEMSMAYLKSIFEAAAFATDGKITDESLINALEQTEHYRNFMKTHKERKTGFTARKASMFTEKEDCPNIADPIFRISSPQKFRGGQFE